MSLGDIYAKMKIKYNYFHYKLSGTKFLEENWARRPSSDKSDWGDSKESWVEGYKESINHPHREYFIEQISECSPFCTVLEIGSNCGPNLYLLAKKFPGVQFYGIDINSEAIEFGKKWFENEGINNIKLSTGFADDLHDFPDKSIDIIFTDAILIYIGPDKIEKVFSEFFRVAKNSIILCEWQNFNEDLPNKSYFDGNHNPVFAITISSNSSGVIQIS